MDAAIFVPVGRNEDELYRILETLLTNPCLGEIHFACPVSEKEYFSTRDTELLLWEKLKDEKYACWHQSPEGRAQQLNFAALQSQAKTLLFLHADSVIAPQDWQILLERIRKGVDENTLYYFDLKFIPSNTARMAINEWGTWIRSRMAMPFGDQGFLCRRKLFEEVGGYPEDAPYGEDHLFVWRARHKAYAVTSIGAWISTSARKYENKWLKTTLNHLIKTYQQAIPQAFKGIKERL